MVDSTQYYSLPFKSLFSCCADRAKTVSGCVVASRLRQGLPADQKIALVEAGSDVSSNPNVWAPSDALKLNKTEVYVLNQMTKLAILLIYRLETGTTRPSHNAISAIARFMLQVARHYLAAQLSIMVRCF